MSGKGKGGKVGGKSGGKASAAAGDAKGASRSSRAGLQVCFLFFMNTLNIFG
jgi:hypothetical protein